MFISSDRKFVVKLAGVSFNTFGAMLSLGPPVGVCMLAHPGKKITSELNIKMAKKIENRVIRIYKLFNEI